MTLYVWEQPPTSGDWERHPTNNKTHPKGMPDEDASSLARCKQTNKTKIVYLDYQVTINIKARNTKTALGLTVPTF